MRRYTDTETPGKLEVAGRLGTLLEAFWEHQDGIETKLDPAYRALTAFLLGIRLLEEWGPEFLDAEALCPVTGKLEGLDWGAMCMHLEALEQWMGENPKFPALQRLYKSFRGFYNGDEDRPSHAVRVGLHREAAGAIRLAAQFQMGDFFPKLRATCLREAARAGDWLTLGLASLDSWWTGSAPFGPPERSTVMATVLATPYQETPLERLVMSGQLTHLNWDGISDGWTGDLGRAVLASFDGARELALAKPNVLRDLLVEADGDFLKTGRNSLSSIHSFYAHYAGSADPVHWREAMVSAAARHSSVIVRIPYAPISIAGPSILRCQVDFALWGGLIAVAAGKGEG